MSKRNEHLHLRPKPLLNAAVDLREQLRDARQRPGRGVGAAIVVLCGLVALNALWIVGSVQPRLADAKAAAEAALEAEQAEKKAQDPEARLKKLEDKQDPPAEKPVIKQSAAAGLAETRIREIINSFRTLSKKRFESWLENNRDQIKMMPIDVKAALAKKIIKTWPGKDPEIDGLNLEQYANSTDATDKGHSNNK